MKFVDADGNNWLRDDAEFDVQVLGGDYESDCVYWPRPE